MRRKGFQLSGGTIRFQADDIPMKNALNAMTASINTADPIGGDGRFHNPGQIGQFYYIGGNDSMDTVLQLDRYFKSQAIIPAREALIATLGPPESPIKIFVAIMSSHFQVLM